MKEIKNKEDLNVAKVVEQTWLNHYPWSTGEILIQAHNSWVNLEWCPMTMEKIIVDNSEKSTGQSNS
jgi:hypothetical protein